jgi:hypothetical protein
MRKFPFIFLLHEIFLFLFLCAAESVSKQPDKFWVQKTLTIARNFQQKSH